MAIVLNKVEIDITIRKFKHRDSSDPIKIGEKLEEVLAEELNFKSLKIVEAIRKLIDLLPYNL